RVEPTAALTAIDVDGGGRRALQTNLDAAREIARQLRLRRIGGTVVIDFVDLSSKRDREALAMELRSAFADDPASVQIYPMSPLGLVQLSRQRLGPTLAEIHARPCACCAGSGRLASLRRQSEILMRELERRRPTRTLVALADDLRQFLQGEGQEAWSGWLARQGLAPKLQVDPTLGPGAYRIEEPSP
ncbi:MAG: ribonuclease E/G, partial [Geminicoccaceae bacterium]